MKAPTTSTITALFAALVATGCTVNIQSRPSAEPSPPPAEEDSVDILVSPTHTPRERTEPRRRVEPTDESTRRTTGTTVTRREDPPPPDSVETVRETTNTTITRREEPPQPLPDTVGTDKKPKESEKDRRAKQPETVATDDPPDRPGVGKGRDESKEKYPGKGNATGLEKQQDKNKENPGQEKATGRDEEVDVKPEDKDKATGQDKKPEPKQEPVAAKQPDTEKKPDKKAENDKATGSAKQPEAKQETVATKQTNTEVKPEPKKETGSAEKPSSKKQEGKKDEDKPAAKQNTVPAQPEKPTESAAKEESSPPVAMLEIPSKELPSPGKCRLWIPGQAAKDQAKSGKCDDLEGNAPAGSWVLYRPNKDKNVVQVKEMDPRRSGVVTRVLSYEVASGKLIGEAGR